MISQVLDSNGIMITKQGKIGDIFASFFVSFIHFL